ncbi:myelin-associated neurite-outgrowth inhibitor isoform X2 [Heterodontus francisci]|uniref:myelin-associated neurite-outgrowth inhibitor isoform X2 n=1 Tax=Heterodontus francisci TaxID=7792 RepID=UPI00355AFCEA
MQQKLYPDSILVVVLKTCAPRIAVPPGSLFPYSYKTGIYLTKWKIKMKTENAGNTQLLRNTMNPVYSSAASGVPYANPKGIGYPGFPVGYAAAAPAFSPTMYAGTNPAFQTGYTPGTPYKVSCSPTSGAVPPYSSSPNPYQTAVYPVRSAYPQQNPYAQQGTYYTQPLYAAPPHVIHHTTVVQPNGMPAAMYPQPIPSPRANGVAMGMVAGTTMAMSAGGYQGTLLTTHSPTPVAPHPVSMPAYRTPGTPTYNYVPSQW